MRSIHPFRGPLKIAATLATTQACADELYTLKIESDSLFSSEDG